MPGKAAGNSVRKIVVAVGILLGSSGCELLHEPFPSALEGRYDADWTYSALDAAGNALLPSLTCSGRMRIDEASMSLVEGSFTIPSSEGCPVSSGVITGVVRRDGGVTLAVQDVEVRFGSCVVRSDVEINGVANRHGMELQGEAPATCRSSSAGDSLRIGALEVGLSARKP